MAADLYIHVLEDVTEDDIAVFNSNTIGSKWFGCERANVNRDLLYHKISATLNIGRSGQTEAVNTGFNQQLNGGILERYIGETESAENQGWKPMMDRYRKVMALAGTANTKWLGTAVDGPQTSPWQNGVYRRRFQNGMALVNPRGNGNRTVTIEPGYRRFLGNQARTINNGNPATSITLQDRDGILLKKN